MLKLSSVIIEDESKAAKVLSNYIRNNFEDIRILAVLDNIQDAYVTILKEEPDIVFLDIQLGNFTGFDLLNKFDKISFHVVFTTAYQEYALKAFDYPTPHFLVKPIELQKLSRIINRIEAALTIGVMNEKAIAYGKSSKPEKLAFSSSQSTELIDYSRIVFLEAEGSYTSVHLVDNSVRISSKILGHYEKVLDDEMFCRIHRKYIVNMNHIIRYDRSKSITIHLSSGEQIQSSLIYKGRLLKKIQEQASF